MCVLNRQNPSWQIVGVAAIAVVVVFSNLGGVRLWDRDEPRNAGCAREMLERNDWVVPTFNAQLRGHKPVLLYWLMMSAYSVFGVNEFAARFWSAVLGTGTVLLTYGMGRRMFGPAVGVWAAVMLATSMMFDVASRAATPDAPLIFFSALGMYFFVRHVFPVSGQWFPRSTLSAVPIYGSLALAALAKGPIGMLVPTAVIGLFLLIVARTDGSIEPRTWRQRVRDLPRHFILTCWRMRLGTAVFMLLLLAVPWYVWVGIRTDGQFLREFFVDHNLNRARAPMEGHAGPIVYYPLVILLGFFPWSIFAVPAILEMRTLIRRQHAWSSGLWLCFCWVAVWVGLFSLAQTKLPSYVTPCYPALALVTACFGERWVRGATHVAAFWPRLGIGTLAVVGLIAAIGIPVATHLLLPGEEWLGLIGLVPLIAAATATLAVRHGRRQTALTSLAAGAVAMSVGLFAVVAARVDRHQKSDVLLATIYRQSAEPRLAAFGCLEPSWVFYAARPVEELAWPGVVDGERTAVDQFLAGGANRYVITTRRHLAQIEPYLPADVAVLEDVPYFLKKDRLVVVGHLAAAGPRTAQPALPGSTRSR
jgi:4-amino-4-deoxy-L-arabinose transferase-like glycosyltransferase